MRKKILLYNPSTVFYDMPLALLAIGSVLDKHKYEVIIIDGRIEKDAVKKISEHVDSAICLGVTVITGAPIKDALKVSKKVKALAPTLPIIWGGWHTSLFPTEPLRDHTFIDITVQAQGEETFVELVNHLENGVPLEDVKGICFRQSEKLVKNPPRPLKPMASFARINYELINVDAYYKKKDRQQFDVISSTGCFFRCSFCADPFVFERKFTAIPGKRLGEELAYFQRKYQFDDLNFQDETFFTYPERIEAFAKEIIAQGVTFSWAATMRADQGFRMTDELWNLCKKSGLRRLLIGVESGSQEMMDYLKKDIKLEQVFHCANKCQTLGISVIFPFIVGFPEETDKSIEATVSVLKRLRKMSSTFETPVFYFKPYPGSAITAAVVKGGYKLPETTEEWGDFDYIGSSGPWVSNEKEQFFEALKFYMNLGYGREKTILLKPLRWISKWRCKNNRFGFPIEKMIIEKLRPQQQLS